MEEQLAAIYAEIEADIAAIESNNSVLDALNFERRADTIDFIDFHLIDRLGGLKPQAVTDTLMLRAENRKLQLQQVDAALFAELREGIKAGTYYGSAFGDMVRKYVPACFNSGSTQNAGYDNLDIFINGLLADGLAPEPTMALEPEMVFYQKTPARVVFELARHLQPGDVFMDIGCGLGQVAILVNLITGNNTIGIEYEPAYCSYANACAAQLNLPNIELINTDARTANYTSATVVFMYTPFTGQILQQVLKILLLEMRKRELHIFTYGPCSAVLDQLPWLQCVYGNAGNMDELCGYTIV